MEPATIKVCLKSCCNASCLLLAELLRWDANNKLWMKIGMASISLLFNNQKLTISLLLVVSTWDWVLCFKYLHVLTRWMKQMKPHQTSIGDQLVYCIHWLITWSGWHGLIILHETDFTLMCPSVGRPFYFLEENNPIQWILWKYSEISYQKIPVKYYFNLSVLSHFSLLLSPKSEAKGCLAYTINKGVWALEHHR